MITILAIALLITRVAATYLLVKVVQYQRELMKQPIDEEITGFRRDLHYLTVALLLSNIPAIILDIFFIFDGLGVVWFIASSTFMLAMYAVGNAVSALLASVFAYRIYKDALKIDRSHPTSEHVLMNNESDE